MFINAIGWIEASNSSMINVPPVKIALITIGNMFTKRRVPKDSNISAKIALFLYFLVVLNIEHSLALESSLSTIYPIALELIPNNRAASLVVFSI